jgi:hypothetical protein
MLMAPVGQQIPIILYLLFSILRIIYFISIFYFFIFYFAGNTIHKYIYKLYNLYIKNIYRNYIKEKWVRTIEKL